MITTVTINPCVDRTFLVKDFQIGKTNRAEKIMQNAGSKGINVSRILQQLGEETLCLGFVGGVHGDILIKELNSESIKHDFVNVENDTRVNIKIRDINTLITTEINEPGSPVSNAELESFLEKFEKHAQNSELIAISGSILPGMEKSIYNQLINIAKKYNKKVFLDTSDIQLKDGIQAIPFCVKPNKDEFEKFVGKKLNSYDEIVAEAKKLIKMGINYVIVTLGNDGAIGISKDEAFKITPPNVQIVSTVGAGDSFLAGMLTAYKKGMSFKKQLIFASSCANAKVTKEGNETPSIMELLGHIDGCMVTDIEM